MPSDWLKRGGKHQKTTTTGAMTGGSYNKWTMGFPTDIVTHGLMQLLLLYIYIREKTFFASLSLLCVWATRKKTNKVTPSTPFRRAFKPLIYRMLTTLTHTTKKLFLWELRVCDYFVGSATLEPWEWDEESPGVTRRFAHRRLSMFTSPVDVFFHTAPSLSSPAITFWERKKNPR